MPLIDHLLSVGLLRKAVWRLWYPYLTRRLRDKEVLFLNYAFAEEPPSGLPLKPDDERDRACIQLYHHVATQTDLRGKAVLEVSCGHGGGASWITRSLRPKSYIGIDLNPEGIAFCQRRHHVEGLTFVRGDAQALPFADARFDAVVNVEASHCYPDFARFVAEVARVLRPSGHFLHADFRSAGDVAAWKAALSAPPLVLRRSRVINPEVLRGLEKNSARSLALVTERLPRLLHGLGRDFAGVPGSRVHEAFRSGAFSYRSFCLKKGADGMAR